MTNDIPFRPRPERLEATIRGLAANSANIRFTNHAQERMLERRIFDRKVLEILKYGLISGDVEMGRERGEWKVKLVKGFGGRDAGVVVLVVRDVYLLIKTVEWEDVR